MRHALISITLSIFAILPFAAQSDAQRASGVDIRDVVEQSFGKLHKDGFAHNCPIYTDSVAARVFQEYGAIFVAAPPVVTPSKCMTDGEADLSAVQAKLNIRTANIGRVAVTLQEPALNALIDARADAARQGLSITPRGGSIASTRSYSQTLDLWRSRFVPALAFWVRKGRIKPAEAAAAREAPIEEQVESVLAWENRGIFFSKDLSKSILYSVAIPGASQHNFSLALDVEQFADTRVRRIMAEHGWFQTVKSDLPHFTYLGLKEADLPANGLRPVMVGTQKFWVPRFDEP